MTDEERAQRVEAFNQRCLRALQVARTVTQKGPGRPNPGSVTIRSAAEETGVDGYLLVKALYVLRNADPSTIRDVEERRIDMAIVWAMLRDAEGKP